MDPEGGAWVVIYSVVGPPEGSTTNVLASKDMWLIYLPKRASDAAIAAYLAS